MTSGLTSTRQRCQNNDCHRHINGRHLERSFHRMQAARIRVSHRRVPVWQANVRVRLSHRRFERHTAPIVAQTVCLASERTRSAVTPPSHSPDRCANCRFGKRTYARSAVTPPVRASHSPDRCANCRFGKRVRLPHRLFERRTAMIVAQTVGLARELTRSAVTPPVRASHSPDRCANCRFGKRAYTFGCHTACSSVAQPRSLCKLLVWQTSVHVRLSHRSVAQPRSLCKLSVWQENVRVRLSNRLRTVGLVSERTRSAIKPLVRQAHRQ